MVHYFKAVKSALIVPFSHGTTKTQAYPVRKEDNKLNTAFLWIKEIFSALKITLNNK